MRSTVGYDPAVCGDAASAKEGPMSHLPLKGDQFPLKGGQSPIAAANPMAAARRHENHVLASLPQADLALLARHLHVVSVPADTVLQHQDHPLDYVYFPHEGVVSLLAMTVDGATVEAASVGRRGAVCPVLKAELSEGFLTAVAHGAMRASRIAATQISMLQRESEALNRALRGCRESLLLQLRQNIACGGLHAVEQRLSRWLLEAADHLESDIVPILATQEHVAQRLGVRRTTVTLLASRLQEAGAIRWGRSKVEIRDRARLESMACGCYAALRDRLRILLPGDPAVAAKGLGG
jgi:CRP-like cAMP-binding protein